MNNSEEGALRSVEKQVRCERCVQRILARVEKLGYTAQYEAIKTEGFEDDKAILKALKKNKGDLVQVIQYLQNPPQKKNKKQKQRDSGEMEIESKKCHKKCKAEKEDRSLDKEERKNQRALVRKEQKFQKMVEEFPQFKEFNENQIKLGFEDVKKNFRAFKKNEGDSDKAAAHLRHKKILESIVLTKTFGKGEINKIYLDCNNCFYLESSFLKKAKNGNFKEIELKIATLMKIFQSSYGSEIEIVLVFDNSKLMKDEEACAQFLDKNYKMVNARPEFYIADDAIVHLASKESVDNQNAILYITSDRLLQARLIEQQAKKIITSKAFFNVVKEDFVGRKAYSAIIDQ